MVSGAGGQSTVTIDASPECGWTATAEVSWITDLTPTSGQGSGQLQFRAAPNPTETERVGSIALNDQKLSIRQAARSCTVDITPRSATVNPGGSTSSFAVTAPAGCTWTVSSDANWLTIIGGAAGTGAGTVTYRAAANTGNIRVGALSIAGTLFTVTQPAAGSGSGCAVALAPTGGSAGPAGGAGSPISVTAQPGCAWTAASNASWLTITSGSAGSGNGTVTYSVAANAGAARTGTLTIGGQTFVVNQSAAGASCTFSIAPTSASAPVGGRTGATVAVTAPSGCAWTATSEVPWLTITSDGGGVGGGTIVYDVAANPGGSRIGTLAVAGLTFTVEQAGGAPSCTFDVAPRDVSSSAAGGPGPPVAVSTSAGCVWSATSNASWLTISAGATGSGSGSVAFAVAPNTGPSRTGTLTIAGSTVTVTQGSACTYQLGKTSDSIGANGGSGPPISVSTTASCTWTAVSNVDWLTVTSGESGTGDGTVRYAVAANSGGARTGTLTIGGETFTVTQAGAACNFSVAPTTVSIAAAGGTGTSITVTTGSACAWTSTSNAPWITITSGAEATGSGAVAYTVAANSGSARSGVLVIAGVSVTVNQAGPCTYTLNRTSSSASANGGQGPRIDVTAPDGCAWTSVSNVSWITVTDGASGSGDGSARFTVARNEGPARVGTLTIAGITFTVTQDAN
jgi:hypothetical protein